MASTRMRIRDNLQDARSDLLVFAQNFPDNTNKVIQGCNRLNLQSYGVTPAFHDTFEKADYKDIYIVLSIPPGALADDFDD